MPDCGFGEARSGWTTVSFIEMATLGPGHAQRVPAHTNDYANTLGETVGPENTATPSPATATTENAVQAQTSGGVAGRSRSQASQGREVVERPW
jgi:hypothetical protein